MDREKKAGKIIMVANVFFNKIRGFVTLKDLKKTGIKIQNGRYIKAFINM